MTCTVGIDLGTTAVKVAVFDVERGRVVSVVTSESTTTSPAAGWAEADAAGWWRAVCAAIPRALAAGKATPDDVAAVATTSMIPAVVIMDRVGRVLRPVILQNDARAVDEIGALRAELDGIDLVALTGSQLTQQSVAPTWRWLHAHEPRTVEHAGAVMGAAEWLAVALGADHHVESNWALESGLYSIDGPTIGSVLQAAQLDESLLARTTAIGTLVGTLSPSAADATGLRSGTPLIVGGADHVLSAAAAGVASTGHALVKLGGAGDLLVFSDDVVTDERLYLDAHPAPGAWLPNGCMATSGSLVRWVRTLTGGAALDDLDRAAAQRRPADVLCLPHFLGEKSPVHDPRLRGAFIGLHLGHDSADLHRSAMEGVAFGFRWLMDVFVELGLEPSTVLVANGGSASIVWKQIIADVLGRELSPVVDHPGAAYGAALAAAIGVGLIGSWHDGAQLAQLGEPIVPRPSEQRVYDEAYPVWHDALDRLTPVSHHLAGRPSGEHP